MIGLKDSRFEMSIESVLNAFLLQMLRSRSLRVCKLKQVFFSISVISILPLKYSPRFQRIIVNYINNNKNKNNNNNNNNNNNSASGDRSPATYKERDGGIHPKDPAQHPNQRPKENHTAWKISHPGEDLRATNSRILSLDKNSKI